MTPNVSGMKLWSWVLPEVFPINRGDFGRLGHGSCNDVFVPQRISLFTGKLVKQVACGDTHTLVVLDSGELYTFGRNQNGQLGLGTTEDSSPQKVTAMEVRSIHRHDAAHRMHAKGLHNGAESSNGQS